MSQQPAAENERKQDGSDSQPRRSRVRRIGGWSLGIVAVVALIMGGLVFWGIGQTLKLPDWVRDRIETRIEQNLGGLQITFGDVEMVVNRGWRPRVRLRNVTLTAPDGQTVVQLTDAESSLAMRPLLRGQVQPKSISLSGAFMTLRRDADGNFSLALGNNFTPVKEAANLPQLIGQIDHQLQEAALSALVSVEMRALTLRYEDTLTNRAWTLDGGQIELSRLADRLFLDAGFALLSGADYASNFTMNYSSRIGETEAEFGVTMADVAAQDIAAQSVGLAWLDVLRAPISGALRGSMDETGKVGPLSATFQIGAGVLQPTDATRPVPFDGAHSYFTYRPADQVLVFDEVWVASGWGTGTAEGRAYLDVTNGRLTDLIGQFTLSDMTINPDNLYEEPVKLARATADFRLELAPFRMTLGQMHLVQEDSNMQLSGSLAADPGGWTLALDGAADRITPERLIALWPERAAPKPRKWIAENISGGSLFDMNFALRSRPGNTPNIYLDFGYDGSTVKFLRTLPPITGADGQASFVDRRFVTTATSGTITPSEGGPVDVSGTSFIIPDVAVKPDTHALVRVRGRGSVTALLSLLNQPPLSVLKGTPLPVALADGRAQLTGTVALPLKPRIEFDEFQFHLAGAINNVESDVLVPGYIVQSPRLRLSGDQSGIELSGPGQIGTVPVQVRWRQPLGKGVKKTSRLDGSVELSERLVDTFGIGLPENSVSGKGSGEFTIDLAPGQPPELALKSDLVGVGLRLSSLGWSKPESTAGLLQLNGVLGTKTRIDRLVLQAAGLAATGAVVNRPGGGLDRALLSSVKIGDWLDATVELIGRGDAAPDLRILDGTLDMRRATFDSGGGGGSSGKPGGLDVTLDRLQVTDTIALTDFSGQFSIANGLNGPFRGKVNGQADVTGTVTPQSGRSAVRIRSNDAGGVVRASGLLSKARGGNFDMTLLPAPQPGQFDGTLRITDTQVRDGPAIVALVNAVSVVGLLDELSGQGIQFAQVDARFRLSPSRVTVFQSSATGPSIGLSMDGIFDVPTSVLKMQGVISPVYLLNQIGNLFSRRGEGMIGFNYTLTGTSQNPRVQVNPLSALTPGILRDIMRAAPPPVDENAPPPPEVFPRTDVDDVNSGR